MDYAEFILRFPEFTDLAQSYVESKLSEAGREISEDHWGERFEDAQGYLCAHVIALSPFGFNARLSTPDGRTSYITRLNELRRQLPKRALLTGVNLP